MLTRDNAWPALMEGVQPGGRWREPGRIYETGDSHYRNEVPAWDVLATIFYRPIRRTSRIRCPLLMIIGSEDTVTPPAAQRKAAAQAGAELVELRCKHFDPFRTTHMPEVIERSAEFLRRHVV